MTMRLSALIVLTLASLPLQGAEKWADPSLKTTDGLILWVDAQRLPAAFQAHNRTAPATGTLVDVAYDASGQGLHLVQSGQSSQPRFVSAGKHAVVRFDGKD